MTDKIEAALRERLKEKYPMVECDLCHGRGYYYPKGGCYSAWTCECFNGRRFDVINREQDVRMARIIEYLVQIGMAGEVNEDGELEIDDTDDSPSRPLEI